MSVKEYLALLVAVIALVNMGNYIRVMLKREIKAHAFSWIIWGATQLIAGAAQYAKGGGAGSYVMIIGALPCFVIAIIAVFYHGERNITRGDKISFVLACSAIPLWIVTGDPVWSSILVTAIDVCGGFYPTVRKSWREPRQESMFLFVTGAFAYGLVAIAQESYSLTTLVYPVALAITEAAMSAMLIIRRKATK